MEKIGRKYKRLTDEEMKMFEWKDFKALLVFLKQSFAFKLLSICWLVEFVCVDRMENDRERFIAWLSQSFALLFAFVRAFKVDETPERALKFVCDEFRRANDDDDELDVPIIISLLDSSVDTPGRLYFNNLIFVLFF